MAPDLRIRAIRRFTTENAIVKQPRTLFGTPPPWKLVTLSYLHLHPIQNSCLLTVFSGSRRGVGDAAAAPTTRRSTVPISLLREKVTLKFVRMKLKVSSILGKK